MSITGVRGDRDLKNILITGAGAAGMMAAIAASSKGNRVTLFERNEKPGKKLFITGKGRCNVTNACAIADLSAHVVTNPKFLYSAFSRFNNQDMTDFLKKQGVETKVERGQRVFPVSDHSSDVIRALKEACIKQGVHIRCNSRVREIMTKEKRVEGLILESGEKIRGDALILATGGSSYPSTGSTGDGYRLAEALGHRVVKPEPSLVPFVIKESWCRDLMGLSLRNVSIKVRDGKKSIYQGFGEMLFTHFGVSGPLILTASTRLGKKSIKKALDEGRLMLWLDLKPALDPDQLDKRFLREFDTWRNKKIANVIEQMLPKSMVPVFLDLTGVDPDKKVHDISRPERRRMAETMKAIPMHITGVRGFDEAIITRGGIHVKEINPSTMESRLVKNLYFAGEIIDVDAETGGYNLQIAWSTGFLAGIST